LKRILNMGLFFVAASAAAFGQAPAIAGGVFNGASSAAPGLPNASIAQGSIFTVYGTNLGPALGPGKGAQQAAYPLNKNLGGISIKVTVGGTTVEAYPTYVEAGQVQAILPSNTPVGTGTITITYNGATSVATPITVVKSSFGTVAVNGQGYGPAVVTDANYQLITLTNPAKPGQTVILWGTGLGPAKTTNDDFQPPVGGDLGLSPQIYLGGKVITPLYAGRAGCCSGEDQINFTIPAGVEGCNVPLAVRIGDVVSNFTSITIASGSVCQDPSFTSNDLLTVGAAGVVREGSINLSRSASSTTVQGITVGGTTDFGSASFARYDITNLLQLGSLGQYSVSTFGSCTVITFRGGSSVVVTPVQPVFLDAGPTITITGPKGTKTLTRDNNLYSATLGGGLKFPGLPDPAPLYLDPGTYTITNGSGGSGPNSVGPFSTQVSFSALLNWTNQDAINTVNRSQGQDFTWSGGDPSGTVSIVGTSLVGSGNSSVGAAFICIEKTSAGHFTVPAVVMLTLPPNNGANDIGSLSVSGGSALTRFTAPNLELGYISVSGGSSKTVKFQ
jgi:uncharacterized protein (TIGR03437 family)